MPGRVLHVLTSDERRGAQTFGIDLHHALAAGGWGSDVVCLRAAEGKERLPVSALGESRHSVPGLARLRSRALQADVVVAHGSSTLMSCALALAGSGVPFVYVNIGDPRFWWTTPVRLARVRLLLRRAAAVVAIAEGSRRAIVDRAGVPPSRVHVIPNARSAAAFAPVAQARRVELRQQLGLVGGGPVLAWVGALSREKRPDVAVEVVARLPGVRLLMAGHGDEWDRVRRLADHHAPGRVHLLGQTDRVAGVLAAADAVLLTSDSEGVPGVLIEAGLLGRPAVATDVGFVREVVVDGVTGRIVGPGRSDLLAVAAGEVLARRTTMGAAARQHCLQGFELAGALARWEDLLERVRRAS